MKIAFAIAGTVVLLLTGNTSVASFALLSSKSKEVKMLSVQLRQETPLCTDTPNRLYDRLLNPIDAKLAELERVAVDEAKYFSKAVCYPANWAQNLSARYSAAEQNLRKFIGDLNSNESNILWGLDGSKPAKYPRCTMDIKGNINSTPPTYTYIKLKQNLFGIGLAKAKGLHAWTEQVRPDNLLSVISGHVQYIKDHVCKGMSPIE